jgi:hypothetical protein
MPWRQLSPVGHAPPSPASPLVLLPPLNLLTGTCRWSATAVAAAPAMGVRGLSGVREITELGWELMSTCQTKPQVAGCYTQYRRRLYIVKTIVMKKVTKKAKNLKAWLIHVVKSQILGSLGWTVS